MKYQQVSVDYWAMGKTLLTYAFLTAMGWLMFRMFNTVFMLPRRLNNQHQSIQKTLEELQKRFPGMDITEEDIKNAEKELEEYMKEYEEQKKTGNTLKEKNEKLEDDKPSTETLQIEEKKTI